MRAGQKFKLGQPVCVAVLRLHSQRTLQHCLTFSMAALFIIDIFNNIQINVDFLARLPLALLALSDFLLPRSIWGCLCDTKTRGLDSI